MTKKKNENDGSRRTFLAGYGGQVVLTPGVAIILFLIFVCFFGFDFLLLWTNLITLAIWGIFVGIAFWKQLHGEFWRNYRWIIAPSVLILLFLFDVSWAQSTMSASSLAKSVIKQTNLDTHLQLHSEYPSQILYDATSKDEIHLWTTGSFGCSQSKMLTISSSGKALLFAVKPSQEAPLEWLDVLSFTITPCNKAVTLLVQVADPENINLQSTLLKISEGNKTLETSHWDELKIESKRDLQTRAWKKNFLETSGVIVSLIAGAFAAIKQLEDEKKRQKAEQIKQSLITFDVDVESDFSNAWENHRELTADWNEWDKGLQDQFRQTYSSFINEKLWDVLANQTIIDMQNYVNLCFQLCERAFERKDEKPVSILNQLQSALEQDENAPLNLLTMLMEHPVSIEVAKQIAAAFHPELKRKTVDGYAGRFPSQVRDLKVELGIPDTESFPLHRQFVFHAKPYASEDRLAAWLNAHEMEFSPFADAESPFYSALDGQLLVDLASPGFIFPTPDHHNLTFEFASSWDTGAAFFAYCQSLKSALKIKEETFFVNLTPSLVENHGTDHPRKLFLHALAEQWEWSLAETPTMFYLLKDQQRDLVGRLLRWHDLSSSITTNKITRFAKPLLGEEKKNQKILLSKINDWLTTKAMTDLRTEEVNALIELRPSPKQKTFFLISTIDLNPRVEKQISLSLHGKFAEQSDWLSSHDCGFIHFSIGTKSQETAPQVSLVSQCNIRVQKCSKNKLVFNQLFDAPGQDPIEILVQKAAGSPGKMVRLGQKLLLQHVAKPSPEDYLQIEDLIVIE